jgi:hypothetical protein
MFYDNAWWAQYVAHVRALLAPYQAIYVDAGQWVPDDSLFADPLHLSEQGAAIQSAAWEDAAVSIRCIALLGRKGEPIDAVEEYCRYLAHALQSHNIDMEICRVSWERIDWPQALRDLESQSSQWQGSWVLLQYTALAWSARGFPQKVLSVLRILKSSGARVAIVFHDVEPYPGNRLIDSFRRLVQVHTMRRALAIADLAIFTVRPENLSWPPKSLQQHAHFIAFSGSETALPITDAGVVLVPPDRPDQLNDALVRVLSDTDLRAELSRRSRDAHRKHFSWESISVRFADLLRQ